MSEKYRNKYRTTTTRMQRWNYGWEGDYFITVCTENREFFFGEVENDKVVLSEIGEIVKNEWIKTFELRADMNLTMGEFVIMPNHIHVIIRIGKNEYNSIPSPNKKEKQNQFGPQSKNIASIFRGFKSAVTMQARKIKPDFAWQVKFHDHIIQNNWAFYNIEKYIIENPQNWKGK